jgi:hypothetical protein
MRSREWIGVDFDGTLVKTMDYKGIVDLRKGEPVMAMVQRVRDWLDDGKNIRIMTARVCGQAGPENAAKHRKVVEDFCLEHFGERLVVTHEKDFDMVELWDDRAVQVERDEGEPVTFWSSKYGQ